MTMEKVNLAAKLSQITEFWRPKVVGELNGQEVKLVKFKGEFVWHHHEHEDELFLVVRGSVRLEFRDHVVSLAEGEVVIVPRGVEHRTVADDARKRHEPVEAAPATPEPCESTREPPTPQKVPKLLIDEPG